MVKQRQTCDNIDATIGMKVLFVCIMALTFFMGQAEEALASVNIAFSKDEHQGKFVQLGGRKWQVATVKDGQAYLVMDGIYATKQWNSANDATNASEVFQFLESELNDIIAVAEDRELIAVTEWPIRSSDMYMVYEHSTVSGKTINPASFTQKLGVISSVEWNSLCVNLELLENVTAWTRSPEYDEYKYNNGTEVIFIIHNTVSGCGVGTVDYANATHGIRPALYLKNTVRIRGGAGTKSDPYVLSVTNDPIAANIEADGTADRVTVQNVPAGSTVKVYAANGTTQIGSQTNGSSPGTVVVSVNIDLRLGDKVYVSFTQSGKAESGKVEATVIDNAPPKILLSAPSTPTKLNVTITATITDGASEIAERKWASGARDAAFFRVPNDWTAFAGNTFAVTENGVYTVYAKDAAGNDSVEQIAINSVDHTAPTLSDVKIFSGNTRPEWAKVGDEIVLTFKASEALGALPQVDIVGKSATVVNVGGLAYRATYTMQAGDPEGFVTFSIQYRDIAGNAGDAIAITSDGSQVQFVRTPPSAPSFSANIVAPTNGDVIVTVNCPGNAYYCMYKIGAEGSWLNYVSPITMSNNGIVYARSYDEAGNESQLTEYEVNHIDREAPVAATFDPDDVRPTNRNVTVTIEYPPDAHSRQFRTNDFEPWTEYTAPVVMHENGTIFARSFDQTGNVSAISKYVVSNIDKEPPIIGTPAFNPGTLTNQDVTVTAAVYDVSNNIVTAKWAIGDQTADYFVLGGSTFGGSFVAKMNGSYTIYARDEAGNATVAAVTVTNIFREEPKITLTAMPTEPTNGSVTVTATVYALHGVEVQKFAFGQHPLEYFATGGEPLGVDPIEMIDNGWITVYVRDPAGNETVEHLEIANIDRDRPVLQLLGDALMWIDRGSPFTDPGATAWDARDGDLSGEIVIAGDAVDPYQLGTYQVEYRVVDRAGNEAEPIFRTVIVYGNSADQPTSVDPPTIPPDVVDEPDEPTDEIIQQAIFFDIENHWAQQTIQQAADSGIISGYPDGTFRPDDPITRAEFVMMLVHALKLEEAEAEPDFADQQQIGSWAKRAIALALKRGIVQGYEDGSFRPHQQITRAEMSAMIARAIGMSEETVEQTRFIDDREIPSWAKAAVESMRKHGIIQGRGDNYFVPNASATRAEAATIMLGIIRFAAPDANRLESVSSEQVAAGMAQSETSM